MSEEEHGPRLAEEIRLLAEMVAEKAAPWLEGVLAAGHGSFSGVPGGGAPGPGRSPGDYSSFSGVPGGGAPGPGDHATPDEAKPAGSACGWCPLCAIVAVVRGERPELVARLAEQLAQLVALLRAVLADRWEPQEGVHMPGFRPAPRPADPRTSPRVQHIAVRRRDEWES
ncbi:MULTISPECIES: hypothetical protein [unclassified Amycolatopsis]|uniref:hypothetical protein n=1 Tax=unclassified Amycolatopsis TaxID=2618356 RepID=UPI002876B391|nr:MULTISPECIES: hypothetical protein [unclassified Amycolatopsis]MDS0139640.1 hypothetical protein [Amycolatopsis sp. 505]MDS0145063.1 hypothetical protein [Amycolatopsis sp. CM201R]